ncbi:MAG: RecX family transcriptional regulator [Alistipes sp.]|nr:RecX family transcriptional regulator [Alistipes sp.]
MRKSRVECDDVTPRERKTKTAEQALNALMRLCSKAEKSSGDALRLMYTWGVPMAERQGVLQKLIELRFIDDARYAEAYTREKSAIAGWGARKIAQHLYQKGIAKEIVERTIATLEGDDQRAMLEKRLQRKLPSVKAANDYELRGKLLRYALGLGYDYDMVISVIDKVVLR